MPKKPVGPLIIVIILVLAILLSGCTGYVKQVQDTLIHSNDPVLRRSEPYLRPIDMDNATLRELAVSAAGTPGDKEYRVNQVYRYLVEQYSYRSDPGSRDYIQPPGETIALRGGDCEDLSILLCSLLENLGIRTYLVLTDSHAYCLVSGVDMGRLKACAQQSMLERLARDYNARNRGDSMIADGDRLYRLTEEYGSPTVKGGYAMYFGGNGSRLEAPVRSLDWAYEVEASAPVTVYLVPSGADYVAICQGRPYRVCPGTEVHDIVRISGTYGGMGTRGGLVVKNDGRKDAAVAIHIKKYTNYAVDEVLSGMRFTSYTLDNRTCVVLDPTAGIYGYPGFCQNDTPGERVAIDPVTKQYYYLG